MKLLQGFLMKTIASYHYIVLQVFVVVVIIIINIKNLITASEEISLSLLTLVKLNSNFTCALAVFQHLGQIPSDIQRLVVKWRETLHCSTDLG